MWDLIVSYWPLVLLVIIAVFAVLIWASPRSPDAARSAVSKLRELGRGSPMLLLFVITFLVVIYLNPAKAGVAWWGVCKLMLSGYAGYWIDRFVFRPEDRPHLVEGIARGTAWKRRALIVAAAILAGGLIP